jgi:hypothetical protein
MRWLLGLVAVSMLAGATMWTCRSAAQSATARSTDVGGGATNPKNTNPEVAVVFDDSAADLPQAAIREAIARELGTPPDHTVVAARSELSIGVERSVIVVRFESPDGSAERRVAIPDDAGQIPELLRLIAGNLARDQRALVEPSPARKAVPPAAPPRAAAASTADAAAPPFRRHWVGLHVAQDFMYEPGTYVCDYGAQDTTYSCYFAGTSDPYRPNPNSSRRSVQRGITPATTRVLASYDYALAPSFTLGGRAGVAFEGGPPGWAQGNGVKGSPFWPVHLEARATWWFLPLTNRRVRAFLGAGGGVMQIDSLPDYVTTCGLDSSGGGSDGCVGLPTSPPTTQTPQVSLDVWRKTGRGFVSARTGMEVRLWEELGVELDVHVIAAFPAFGLAIEPSLGLVYGL